MREADADDTNGGIVDDLVETFVAPARAFERRRDGRYGLLLLILMVVTGVIMVATMGLSAPYWDAQFDASMRMAAAKGQALPPEATGELARTGFRWVAVVTATLAVPFLVWLGALFVALGGKLAGASIGYRQGAAIMTLASMPRLLAPVAMAVQGLLVDPAQIRSFSDASLGPARFMNPETTSPVILSLLGNFDLTSLWSFALLGIGISVVGRVSRGNGFIGAAFVLAISLAVSLIPAAVS